MVGPHKKMETSNKYGIPDSFNMTTQNLLFLMRRRVKKCSVSVQKVISHLLMHIKHPSVAKLQRWQ
jgi:hypothetical protein